MYWSSRRLRLIDRTVDGWHRLLAIGLQLSTSELWMGMRAETRSGWSGWFQTVYINPFPGLSLVIRRERPSKTVVREEIHA